MNIHRSFSVIALLGALPFYTQAVQLLGQVQVIEHINVVAEVSGVLDQVEGDVGEAVSKGTKLAAIQTFDYELAVRQQMANLELAKSDLTIKQSLYERYRALKRKNSLSQNELDVAKADFDASKASLDLANLNLDEAKRNLNETQVQSEIRGIITQRKVNKGAWVERGELLYQIVNIDQINVRFFASQYDLQSLSVGMPITLWTERAVNQKINAQVTRIGVQPDENTQTYPVFVTVKNTAHVYKPGMTVYGSTERLESSELFKKPE